MIPLRNCRLFLFFLPYQNEKIKFNVFSFFVEYTHTHTLTLIVFVLLMVTRFQAAMLEIYSEVMTPNTIFQQRSCRVSGIHLKFYKCYYSSGRVDIL